VHRPCVAHRPPDHRDQARHRGCPTELRPRGQALRGHRRTLPTTAGQPQGIGRVLGAFLLGRWWRTLTARTPSRPRSRSTASWPPTGDARGRRGPGGERTTVGALADTEPLMALPWAPYPATICDERTVADNATVAFRGNRYSVPPGLSGSVLEVRHRLGTQTLEVHGASGALVGRHVLAPAGSGIVQRLPEHRAALEAAVLAAFTTARPCDRKANRPPGPEALAEAARLLAPTDATLWSTWRPMPSWWR